MNVSVVCRCVGYVGLQLESKLAVEVPLAQEQGAEGLRKQVCNDVFDQLKRDKRTSGHVVVLNRLNSVEKKKRKKERKKGSSG